MLYMDYTVDYYSTFSHEISLKEQQNVNKINQPTKKPNKPCSTEGI